MRHTCRILGRRRLSRWLRRRVGWACQLHRCSRLWRPLRRPLRCPLRRPLRRLLQRPFWRILRCLQRLHDRLQGTGACPPVSCWRARHGVIAIRGCAVCAPATQCQAALVTVLASVPQQPLLERLRVDGAGAARGLSSQSGHRQTRGRHGWSRGRGLGSSGLGHCQAVDCGTVQQALQELHHMFERRARLCGGFGSGRRCQRPCLASRL